MSDLFAGVVPFTKVAEHRSFRGAAADLGVTPAAISKAVRRLEDELGVTLFHRTTRRVRLSAEGELFLRSCQESIAQLRAGRDLVAMSQSATRGEIRVSASFVVGRFLTSRLPIFFQRYPGLHVELSLTDRLARLVDDNVDVAIRVGSPQTSSLVGRKIHSTRWTTIASPSYLAKHGHPTCPSELQEHECLRFRTPKGRVASWTFAGLATPMEPPGRVDLNQGELLVDAAMAGLGIAQVFGFMTRDAIREGKLVEVLAEHRAEGPPLYALTTSTRRRTPRVRVVLDFLAEIFREIGS